MGGAARLFSKCALAERRWQVSASLDPKEFKACVLRECSMVGDKGICDEPGKAAEYWRVNIATHPYFNPDVECFIVLYVNTRRRVIGHCIISTGTLDTLLVHPREVFRLAVLLPCAAIVLMHNHPSGDPSPSEADIKVTRDLIRAGQMMRIDVLDHVIMSGNGQGAQLMVNAATGKAWVSLKELGYFML